MKCEAFAMVTGAGELGEHAVYFLTLACSPHASAESARISTVHAVAYARRAARAVLKGGA